MGSRSVPVLALALLVACKPDPGVVHRERGDELLQRSDFAGAAAEYERSLEVKPRQEKVWEKLAFSRMKAGQLDLAARALVRTVEFQTTDARKAEVYRNAAGIFLQTPESEKAEPYLLEAVRLDPKDEASLAWLGELAAQRGGARQPLAVVVPEQLDRAISFYERLIALEPDAKAPHVQRRIVLLRYLGHLGDERRVALLGLRRGGKVAAEARERLGRIDARSAELQRKLDESNEKIGTGRARSPRR